MFLEMDIKYRSVVIEANMVIVWDTYIVPLLLLLSCVYSLIDTVQTCRCKYIIITRLYHLLN
jgi:hypothetical protein